MGSCPASELALLKPYFYYTMLGSLNSRVNPLKTLQIQRNASVTNKDYGPQWCKQNRPCQTSPFIISPRYSNFKFLHYLATHCSCCLIPLWPEKQYLLAGTVLPLHSFSSFSNVLLDALSHPTTHIALTHQILSSPPSCFCFVKLSPFYDPVLYLSSNMSHLRLTVNSQRARNKQQLSFIA